MAKIKNNDNFNNFINNITSFSHAYLFNTNSLSLSYDYIVNFAKKIICPLNYSEKCDNDCNICYQIEKNEFDDLYVINPDTIGINNDEIDKLFEYMKTKSYRKDGRRVYIIYGFERISHTISNKILKFLDEPVDNLYALLITENIDEIIPTIISRCQVVNLMFEKNEENAELYDKMILFLRKIDKCKNNAIAYYNDFFEGILLDRIKMYDAFQYIEDILSNIISSKIRKTNINKDDVFEELPLNSIINILEITSNLKGLIKKNINLNLLLDRYIIEISKELDYAKNSRNNV